MKKVLLFSLIFCFFAAHIASAYQTIIIDFPRNEKWDVVYYRNLATEAILQYVPAGQTYKDWDRTVIVHSYRENEFGANYLIESLILQLTLQNPTGKYKRYRNAEIDAVAVRTTSDYKKIKGQGEILRTTKAPEGLMSIQYIDRNKERFHRDFKMWVKIIRDARTYNSYWRDDRFMNKSESYEL